MKGSRWIAPLALALLWSVTAVGTRPGAAAAEVPVSPIPVDVPGAIPLGPGPVSPLAPPAVEPVDPPVPTVTLRVRVPASSGPDDELQYRILVENPSRASAHHVAVRNPLPANVRFVRATPEPTEKEPELRWRFGTLEPGARKEIVLVVKPTGPGEVRNCARVQFEHGQCVTTRVGNTPAPVPGPMPRATPDGKAELRLRIAGPAQAIVELGPVIDFETELTNVGTALAKGVVLTNKLPAELAFANSDPAVTGDQMGVVTWNLGDLAPGQTRRVRCTVIPKAVGKFTLRAEARDAAGGLGDASRGVAVGEPKLTVVTAGPKVRLVNRPATYLITVSNPGTMPVTNVAVTTEITEGMALQSASGDAHLSSKRTRLDKRLDREVTYQELRWSLGALAPGDRRILQMVLQTSNEGTLDHRVTATADRNLEQHAEVRTLFEKITGMHLEVVKTADPISVGEEATYTFHAINQGDGAAPNVAVTIHVPGEMEVLKDKLEPTARVEGQTVTFTLPELAAGAKGTFVLKVRALKPGEVRLTAKLLCGQLMQGGPVTNEETATIVADGPGK
jgi:uncharacterized repeat protein (TIGR01451 family)